MCVYIYKIYRQYILICIYIHIYLNVREVLVILLCAYIHIYNMQYTSIYIYIGYILYMRDISHIYMYIHIDVYMCMCVCVCVYIYIYTYIYIYIIMTERIPKTYY